MKKRILKWLFGHDFEDYCDMLNLASSVNTEAKDILDKFTAAVNCTKEVIEQNKKLREENEKLSSKLLDDKFYISCLEEENMALKLYDEDDIK